MLLAADSTNGTVADAQVSQIKELLSASLSHFTDVPNFSNAEFRVFLQFCVNAAEQLGATRTTTKSEGSFDRQLLNSIQVQDSRDDMITGTLPLIDGAMNKDPVE